MTYGGPRVKQQHARAGVAHHFLYLLFHVWAIAMDGASLAGGLVFSKFAALQPLVRIGKKLLAVGAERFVALFIPAIDAYHV